MDIFRTPGAALEGSDKKKFDEAKELIDSATHDFLVRADWNANMSCVDKINSIHNVAVLNEILFYLRKKLGTKVPQTVGLTMQLLGSMVNNCGVRFHKAINDEKFMREVGNAIRYFSKRPGSENKDVTDVSLDLVQSWGEAFLPQRKQFYHIVDLYFNLRKEGLPFKAQQFDPTRVPIFVNNAKADSTGDDTDAILAAALQSSMELEERNGQYAGRERENSRDAHSHHQRQDDFQAASADGNNTSEVVESLASCMAILKEVILASTHQMDFRHNEVAQDVLDQLKSFQAKMPALIERALVNDPDGVVSLFALNEDSQALCNIFGKIKSCEVNLLEGQRQARQISCGGHGQQQEQKQLAAETLHSQTSGHHHGHHAGHHTHGGGGVDENDLLGLGDYSPRHTAPSPPQQSQHQSHLQQEARHSPHQHQQTHHQPHLEGRFSPAQQGVAAGQYAPQHYQGHHDGGNHGHGMRIPPPINQPPAYGQAGHIHHSPSHGHAHATPTHGHTPVHPPNRMVIPPPPSARTPVAAAHAHAPTPVHAQPHAHPHAPLPATVSDNVITVTSVDPFAPDALDALFGDAPAKAPAQRVNSAGIAPNEALLPQPKDPFAPDALDALFEAVPAASVSVAKAKVDPFSPQALDALFDTPVPVAHNHTAGHAAHHTTHQQSHAGYVQHVQYDQFGMPVHPGYAQQQVPIPAQYGAPQHGYPQQPHHHATGHPQYAQQYATAHVPPHHAAHGGPHHHPPHIAPPHIAPPHVVPHMAPHMVPPPHVPHHDAHQAPPHYGHSANPFD